jgi:hypothetical protein
MEGRGSPWSAWEYTGSDNARPGMDCSSECRERFFVRGFQDLGAASIWLQNRRSVRHYLDGLQKLLAATARGIWVSMTVDYRGSRFPVASREYLSKRSAIHRDSTSLLFAAQGAVLRKHRRRPLLEAKVPGNLAGQCGQTNHGPAGNT